LLDAIPASSAGHEHARRSPCVDPVAVRLPQASFTRLLGGTANPTLGELLKEGIAV
jgi:hypothetical protein